MNAILLVEDDEDIRELYTTYLVKEGYVVDSAADGEEAARLISSRSYQLIILDLMIPRIDGFEILTRIRQNGNVPVMIISSKSSELDKILGLRLGADDYLAKPFGLGEFIARVKALLRRYLDLNPEPVLQQRVLKQQVLQHEDITLNMSTREVLVAGIAKDLTVTEFAILQLFLMSPSRVFSKLEIFKAVWQQDYLSDENTIMVHIRRLRSKIEPDSSHPTYIQTVWGIGYKLGRREAG